MWLKMELPDMGSSIFVLIYAVHCKKIDGLRYNGRKRGKNRWNAFERKWKNFIQKA